MKIKVTFNENKQWIYFHVGENLRRFKSVNQCHAYYVAAESRLQRKGLFGHVYIPTADISDTMLEELKAHEIQHFVFDWLQCRKGWKITAKNEERMATMAGEVSRKFYKKYLYMLEKVV